MQQILDALAQKEQSRAESFLSLARSIASNKEPSIDVVEQVLEDSDRTTAELQKLVTLLQRRTLLAGKLSDGKGWDKEREQIREQIEKADKALQAADERHTSTVVPLTRRYHQLEQQEQQAAEARNELIAKCPDETLVKMYKDLNAELSALRDKGHALRRTVGGKRSEAIDLQREVSAANRTGDRCDFIEKLENANFQAEKAERELPAVVTRIAEAEAELVTTEAKMLVP